MNQCEAQQCGRVYGLEPVPTDEPETPNLCAWHRQALQYGGAVLLRDGGMVLVDTTGETLYIPYSAPGPLAGRKQS